MNITAENGAITSDDNAHRWALWRTVGIVGEGSVLFIMLNPSTADAHNDDPTIRRCRGFAFAHGFNRLLVANLFAFRATDPDDLLLVSDAHAVGDKCDEWILWAAAQSRRIVCAWGANPIARWRVRDVLQLLKAAGHEAKLAALGRTQNGAPKHPLYVPSKTPLEVFP